MNEIKIGNNIMKYRRKAGFTQDTLAEQMGVSKSSVSKWETGHAYPDILLLPELASLFNISLDELVGYEPQLTKKAILKLYGELKEEIVANPKGVYERCEELVKKYYSCFPFLYQIAILYLNHAVLFDNQQEIMEQALELCHRIEKESGDAVLIKESVSLECIIYTVLNRPEETLRVLGEEARPISQDAELIGASFQMMGNMEKADEIIQVCTFQHLLFMIQDSVSYMMINTDKKELCEETIKRLLGVMELYQIENLHFSTALQVYIGAATIYAMQGEKEKALKMLEAYTAVLKKNDVTKMLLKGDGYFTKVEQWLDKIEISRGTPRGSGLIKESMSEALEKNPVFESLKNEQRFQSCVEKIKEL